MRWRWVGIVLVTLCFGASATAEESKERGGGASDLAALLQDPLSTLAALSTDNKVSFRSGEDNDEA